MVVADRSKGALKDLGVGHGLVMKPALTIEVAPRPPKNQGNSMAVKPSSNQAPEDFAAHEHDYSEFIRIMKYGAIAAFVTGFLVLLIL